MGEGGVGGGSGEGAQQSRAEVQVGPHLFHGAHLEAISGVPVPHPLIIAATERSHPGFRQVQSTAMKMFAMVSAPTRPNSGFSTVSSSRFT